MYLKSKELPPEQLVSYFCTLVLLRAGHTENHFQPNNLKSQVSSLHTNGAPTCLQHSAGGLRVP